ncbi:velvet factor-domain-containing protein [Rhypophila decipiens]|uniref:Velvet factor-domain-containing protein n=1 Tax=Rhypophila decipiens TaxID=261697 RepID=A0AAN6YBH6_9PEZI|nr:velvet factor-domain-containing protein [Rhypophila decipiens]
MGAQVVASAAAHGIPAREADSQPPHIISRYTKGGRRLWYCLRVIQQPERARACGSGPKSSADRRPVDPPPVVELRIYEGQTWEQAQDKDITFVYGANFFLYATLEHARVMAHGRVQTPAANTPPVLTGMPVSGMAYLDRPLQAGYFLFPDLSVRHEGRYRLTFNLYEETKDDKDKDPDTPDAKPVAPGTSSATGGSFDFRMEVKSQDFVVYSAKKFPGLSESTSLSRMVAEQGCRVRIRRDVRMRRRGDDKGGGDFGNGEDEFARRARRTATPDVRPDPYRARSMSGSVERTPYSADARRPSVADYPPQFSAHSTQSSNPGGHLQFLGSNSNSQYPSQPQSFAQPPSVPPSPSYPPSQGTSFSGQSSYPPPPPPAYAAERTPSYASINPAPRRDSEHQDYRSSTSSVNTRLPPISVAQQMTQQPANQDRPTLPPLLIDSAPPAVPRFAVPSPTTIAAPPRTSSISAPGSAGFAHPPPPQYAGTKRSRDKTFRVDNEGARLQDGAREQDNVEDVEPVMMFRRANGEHRLVDENRAPFFPR